MDKKAERAKEYRKYLNSPEWKSLRLRAIDRAGGRCQICNVAKTLHVHHRTYERFGFEELGDLTVLCAKCHRLFHESKNPKLTKHARSDKRRQIEMDILRVVEDLKLAPWCDVYQQLPGAPRAQAWARCQKLIKRGKLKWLDGRLCLADPAAARAAELTRISRTRAGKAGVKAVRVSYLPPEQRRPRSTDPAGPGRL